MTRWYVCGNYREFREWRYAHEEIETKDIVFVSEVHQLCGVSGEVRIVRLSSFHEWDVDRRIDFHYYTSVIRLNPNVIPHKGKLISLWRW